MKDVTADKAQKAVQKTAKHAAGSTELDRCYGKIGISAVAAAARYQGAAKNPAYAPVPVRHDWAAEAV
jgi:hypothetical protein